MSLIKSSVKKKIHHEAHLESGAIIIKKYFNWDLREQGTQTVPIIRVKLIVCK